MMMENDLNNLTTLQDDLIKFLYNHARGKDNAVKGRRLEQIFTVPSKRIRDAVNNLRYLGYPVGSGNEGYYFCQNEAEIKESMKGLELRVRGLLRAIDGMWRVRRHLTYLDSTIEDFYDFWLGEYKQIGDGCEDA